MVKSKRKGKKLKIILSVLALIEVIVLAAGTTFSWIEGGKRGKVLKDGITISSGSNLTMYYQGSPTSEIIVPSCKLEETSSVDGRNFFFPMPDNTSKITSSMTFREGTSHDVNQRYMSFDFDLVCGDASTSVYLSPGTVVSAGNQETLKALRMSLSYNDGSDPLVFKPDQMPGVTEAQCFDPITSINSSGTPTTTTKETESYGDYYYKGENSTPIFELSAQERKRITLTVWLEGTLFDGNSVADKEVNIDLEFTTSVDDLVKYQFVDKCHNRDNEQTNNWVEDNITEGSYSYQTMMYLYNKDNQRYYAMYKSSSYATDKTWTIYVPNDITNFTFRRYSIDIDDWWNEWSPSMSDMKTKKFIAICGQENSDGRHLDGCYGYWRDSTGTFRVYFREDTTMWDTPYCYAWTNSGASTQTGAYPGKAMTYVKNVDVFGNSKKLYYFDLKDTENLKGIQFNNGNRTRIYLVTQNYGSETWGTHKLYMYKTDNSGDISAAWSGDNVTGITSTYFYRTFTFNSSDYGKEFAVIANDGGSNQWPRSGEGLKGKLGKIYEFKNHATSLDLLDEGQYEYKDTQLFFNGFCGNKDGAYNSSTDSHDYSKLPGIYTDSDDSLIYPN